MKQLFILFISLLSLNAYAEKVSANNIGQSNGPSFGSSLCYYETLNGFRFSVVINSSMCPFTVYYDTRKGTVSQDDMFSSPFFGSPFD